MSDKEKIVNLYNAVNEMMAYLGMEGDIDTRNPLTEAVMDALYQIDGGDFLLGTIEKLLSKIEHAPGERQESLFG